jgi:glycopeptide antibiotics resistance protein
MINFFSKYKIFFYSANIILIFLYLFPGSLIGCFLYNDCKIQPQIIRDLPFISTNHVFAFILLSLIAWLTYFRYSKIKWVFYYLCFLSIILEVFHLLIRERGFELADVIGNLLGVFIIHITYEIFKKNYEK